MAFLQDVGNFFKNLGTGVTTTVQGFGENIQSQAALNEAQAQAIIAASQNAAAQMQIEAEAQKRRDNLILYIIIAIAAVPILGMAIFYGLKK
jgi:nitrate reductase NapE component